MVITPRNFDRPQFTWTTSRTEMIQICSWTPQPPLTVAASHVMECKKENVHMPILSQRFPVQVVPCEKPASVPIPHILHLYCSLQVHPCTRNFYWISSPRWAFSRWVHPSISIRSKVIAKRDHMTPYIRSYDCSRQNVDNNLKTEGFDSIWVLKNLRNSTKITFCKISAILWYC